MTILERIIHLLAAEANDYRLEARKTYTQFNATDLDGDQDLRDAISEAVRTSGESAQSEIRLACDRLGLARHHSLEELRTAWRNALLTWHPDVFVSDDTDAQHQATERTREINAAYLLLRNQL